MENFPAAPIGGIVCIGIALAVITFVAKDHSKTKEFLRLTLCTYIVARICTSFLPQGISGLDPHEAYWQLLLFAIGISGLAELFFPYRSHVITLRKKIDISFTGKRLWRWTPYYTCVTDPFELHVVLKDEEMRKLLGRDNYSYILFFHPDLLRKIYGKIAYSSLASGTKVDYRSIIRDDMSKITEAVVNDSSLNIQAHTFAKIFLFMTPFLLKYGSLDYTILKLCQRCGEHFNLSGPIIAFSYSIPKN